MPVVIFGTPPRQNVANSIVLRDNYLTKGVFSSSGDLPAYPGENAIDPATYNSWRGSGTSSSITSVHAGTFGAACLGIAAHNAATNGCEIFAQYSTDSGSTWTNCAPGYTPTTNEDFMIIFPSVVLGNAWRVRVRNGNCNIGVAFLGPLVSFPHTPIDSYTPLHHARQYTKLYNRSIPGHLLSNRVMGSGAETTVDFGFVRRDFVDGPLVGFEDHYNRGGTFFYAGWPEGKPRDMGYCWAPTENSRMNVEYIEGDKLASLSFDVASYVG